MNNLVKKFEKNFKNYLKKRFSETSFSGQKSLARSMEYTLMANSSLFRVRLSLATMLCLNQKPEKIFPFAIFIEMIHGASLIQDDLPCMDNAQKRRGKKSNHIIFKEDLALLSGSSLFVEAFYLLSHSLFEKKRKESLKLIVDKIGFHGLMGGQALDIRQPATLTKKFYNKMAGLKTGSLIELCVEIPLLLFSKKKNEKKALSAFARSLGLSYQMADDLKDKDIKIENLKSDFKKESLKSLKALKKFEKEAKFLRELILDK